MASRQRTFGRRIRAGILAFPLLSLMGAFAGAQERMTKAVDEVFADLAQPGSPGCALAVARDGKTLYEKGYGLANIEENVAITPQTVFDIGSTSKQFTAASILLLEKQGKLSVQDDIRKYVPEVPDYGHKITILHLLNHTSGLRDYLTLFELAGVNTDSVTTDDDALAIIARQKSLNFEPGSEWLYSNSGFFLLSVIVKRAGGKTLREFASENIFAPLQMKQTVFRNEHTQLVPNRALAYDPQDANTQFTLDVSYFEQTGDGAVHTSVEDLLKWDENFYSGKVGDQDFLKKIQEPGKLNNGKTLDYAKGLFVGSYRGLRFVDHGGSWGGYRAQLLRFPDQHFSVACLCNLATANPDKRAHEVADVFLAAEMNEPKPGADRNRRTERKRETLTLSAEKLSAYGGEFKSDELAATYSIGVKDGILALQAIQGGDAFLRSRRTLALRAVAPDTFVADEEGLEFVFERGASGTVQGFRLSAGRTKGIVFQRRF
jgi:CubicO group peptidase (beta-lactamase class C family)